MRVSSVSFLGDIDVRRMSWSESVTIFCHFKPRPTGCLIAVRDGAWDKCQILPSVAAKMFEWRADEARVRLTPRRKRIEVEPERNV
ncbi:hypothetical protein J2R80_004473 [Bradyrhizobium sp. USDA 4541]|nr:hypothetical protein [Bradyrhizobium sp. USDA 4541]